MPIIKEVEFHDNSYNSSTKIFPYLNVSEASHLRFSVQCSQSYDLILDWSWDSNFVSFQTDTYSALGGVILYQPTDIKSRYVQVSISLNSIPSVVHLSGFYNTTDNNDSGVVSIANQPISTTFTNSSINASITNTPSVNIANSPSVSITGQPISTTFTNSSINASITNTPSVNIANSPSVSITGQPISTTISGTPSINIANLPIATTISNSSLTTKISNQPLSMFGEMSTSEIQPLSQYTFNLGEASTNMLTNALYPNSYLRDLQSWSTGFVSTVGAILTRANGVCHFGGGGQPNDRAILYSNSTRSYSAGQGIVSRYTAYFKQAVKNIAGDYPSMMMVGTGNINRSTYRPRNLYAFGYGDSSLVGGQNQNNFGIVYYNEGSKTFYARTAWNIDKADGSGTLPNIDFSKMNVFDIRFQYLGFGYVQFSIENPSTGLMVPVHYINRVNSVTSPSNLSYPSVNFIAFYEQEAPAINQTLGDEVGFASYGIFKEGYASIPYVREARSASKNTVSAEANILTLWNTPTLISSQENYSRLVIDHLSAAVDGTKSAIIRIYRNATLTGTSYSLQSTPLPVRTDTSGTFTGYSNGLLLLIFPLAKVDQLHQDLESADIVMNAGDTITITASSTASTDVIVSVSMHLE